MGLAKRRPTGTRNLDATVELALQPAPVHGAERQPTRRCGPSAARELAWLDLATVGIIHWPYTHEV